MRRNHTDPILGEIQSLVEEKQLSFLIGAGFSRNISKKFPLWRELLSDAIWNMYGTGKNSDRVKKGDRIEKEVLREHDLLDVASRVVSAAGFHEAIDDYIEEHTPYLALSGNVPVLMKNGLLCHDTLSFECHRLLRQLDVANIYTFNYDNALEFCLKEKSVLEGKKAVLQEELKSIGISIQEIEEHLRRLPDAKSADTSLNDTEGPVEMPDDYSKIGNNNDSREDLVEKRQQLRQTLYEKKTQLKDLQKDIEQAYLVVRKSSDIALTSSGHNIYKIHGDLRMPPRTNYGFDGDKHAQYIITQEDYDTYEAKHSAFVNLMRIDLLRNRFCIIGVSGGDANFLAWINWVKDVLDKSGSEEAGQKWSFFVHSGEKDLSSAMKQMLHNHFIRPVILKDIFPNAVDEKARVKAFLEAIQPNKMRVDKLSRLWNEVDRRAWQRGDASSLPVLSDADSLYDLSSSIVFHKALSSVHRAARDVVGSAYLYLKDVTNLSRTKILASALHCSMLPVIGDLSTGFLSILRKSKSTDVSEACQYATRRVVLLSKPTSLSKTTIGDDAYSGILKRLFLFDFPDSKECDIICKTGLDYVRLYSLRALLYSDTSVVLDQAIRKFASPQELVLAADWLNWLSLPQGSLLDLQAKKYRKEYSVFRLSDYFQSYITEMREKKDVSSYGDVQEIVYLDGWHAGFENAAIILNSVVELGITFSDHTVLSDADWTAVAKEVVSEFPYPVAFYTIARDSRDNVIKRVAQELIYDKRAYSVAPDLLKRMMLSLINDNTPSWMLVPISKFARELLVAVPVAKWGASFKKVAEQCLDYADTKANVLITKSLYQFVSEGIQYIGDKTLKLRLLKRVLSAHPDSDFVGNAMNALAIAAREGLSIKDFSSLEPDLINYSGKKRIKRIEVYVLINLANLLSKKVRRNVSDVLEKHALKDANMTGSYASLIRKDKDLAASFKQRLTSRADVWQTGLGKGTIGVGDGHVKISRIDRLLHFDKKQVLVIYTDLKSVVATMRSVFEKPGRKVIDQGFMSEENTFREVVIDMMLFVHNHREELEVQRDFEQVCRDINVVYHHCLYGKTILQLLADDKSYIAMRSMMTQMEINGIGTLKAEYHALLGKLLVRKSKEINLIFQHIEWAIRDYKSFFNTEDFCTLLQSVLDSYSQFFVKEDQRKWDVPGCEKEVAEKYLVAIAKTLGEWGKNHPFWGDYKEQYFVKN